MKYAHLYNAPRGRFQIIITSGPAISEGVLDVQVFESKKLAKAWAKAEGAKAWNY